MLSYSEYITEAFDKPYKYTLKKTSKEMYEAKVKLPDGSLLEIEMSGIDWGDNFISWTVSFARNDSMGVTGGGDQMRIFATVIDAVEKFVKKESPEEVRFTAEKTKGAKGDQKGSREKLYGRLIKRFAGKMGYESEEVTDSSDTTFYLRKK